MSNDPFFECYLLLLLFFIGSTVMGLALEVSKFLGDTTVVEALLPI
jgi:hypothetical protein